MYDNTTRELLGPSVCMAVTRPALTQLRLSCLPVSFLALYHSRLSTGRQEGHVDRKIKTFDNIIASGVNSN